MVTFPALTPTTGAQPYYDVTATLAGYDTMPEDLPPGTAARFALAPAQTKNTGIRLFKPATIYVERPELHAGRARRHVHQLLDLVGSYIGSEPQELERAQLPVSVGDDLTITTINGEKIIPGVSYTVGVLKEVNPGPVALLRAVDDGDAFPPAIRPRSRRRSA